MKKLSLRSLRYEYPDLEFWWEWAVTYPGRVYWVRKRSDGRIAEEYDLADLERAASAISDNTYKWEN